MVTYTYAYFTADDVWPIPADVTHVDALIVAGGGAGQGKQAGNVRARGGGGAGGVLDLLAHELLSSGSVSLLVGKGGTSGPTSTSATSGGDSVFDGQTAIGGGRGGSGVTVGGEAGDGGSGGGTSESTLEEAPIGRGTPGQGYDGGIGTTGGGQASRQGGGGGASQAGYNGTSAAGSGGGGDGISLIGTVWEPLTIIGMPDAIAGGGGGGAYRSSGTHVGGPGGFGGGGEGGTGSLTVSAGNGKDAVPGTGSGGGGAGGNSSSSGNATSGGAGADGFVALRFVTAHAPVITDFSPKEGNPGDTVTITGTGFSDVTSIYFGGAQATSVTIIDDNTIEVIAPSNEGNQAIILISSPGITILDDEFVYVVDSRITQMMAYSVDLSNQPTLFTQIAVYGVTVPVQPVRFTQIPILTVDTPRPVPFPVLIVPETPVTEVWVYASTVTVADSGKEQRIAIRGTPKYSMRFNLLALSGQDRRELFDILYKFQGKEFLFPFYQYGVSVDAANIGDTSLVFDETKTDIRSGDHLAVYDPHNETTSFIEVDIVSAGGASLAAPLTVPVGPGCFVLPVSTFRLPSLVGLETGTITATATMRIETVIPRDILPNDQSARLTKFDGRVVFDKRPMADIDDMLDHGVRWTGTGTSLMRSNIKWRMALANGRRSYIFDRYVDINYWRAFAQHCKGRQETFLMPTYFNDLPLHTKPALNASDIITSNIQADEYLGIRSYQYLRIVRANRKTTYHRVVRRKLNYDANGDPETVTVTISPGIGNVTGDNDITIVSFMNICRLNDDNITLTHYHHESTIEIGYKAVNE